MDYLTLAELSEAKYTEKMSKFLAFAHPWRAPRKPRP